MATSFKVSGVVESEPKHIHNETFNSWFNLFSIDVRQDLWNDDSHSYFDAPCPVDFQVYDGKRWDQFSEFVHAGNVIEVEFTFSGGSAYQRKDGNEYHGLRLKVRNIRFVDGVRSEPTAHEQEQFVSDVPKPSVPAFNPEDVYDADIPF